MAVRNQQIWPYGWYANSLNNAKRAPSVQSDWAAGIQPSSVDAKFTGSPFSVLLTFSKSPPNGIVPEQVEERGTRDLGRSPVHARSVALVLTSKLVEFRRSFM
jgi:hypothetical protein